MSNKMLAPSDGMTIRQPTDSGQQKGNVQNPPRFTNLGFGGLNDAKAQGLDASPFEQKAPGETLRPIKNMKGSRD